jgi:hypothetical protein
MASSLRMALSEGMLECDANAPMPVSHQHTRA